LFTQTTFKHITAHKSRLTLPAVILATAIAAGCSGGSKTSSNASPSPTPTPTPSIASLSATPASLDFGTLAVNGTASQTVKVTNNGTAGINITQDTVTGTAFSAGITTPLTLNAGQSANVTIVFSPKVAGSASGSLTLAGNGAPALTIALSGNAVAAAAHSVDIAWDASTSANVQGYNVYRGTTSGGPYTKISPTLSGSALSFTDIAPVSGSNYFYIVTSVDSTGLESTASNEVRVAIPTP
jgi:Abnormal spindle-like microcephaly-assoc'd, ASPM-SPD-2-Hydin